MKKYLAVLAVAVLVAFAAPAFAATNPFMDVPLNHWAYDAIGQLAAQGILSGYPDGTYKGRQPTTRYEMASALARALAVVDMTKASKQDVEMLKRLVIEFKDELDALGVQVDELDEKVTKLHNRLNGWQLGGQLRVDLDSRKTQAQDGTIGVSRGRLFFDRYFGENESLRFHGRVNIPEEGNPYFQYFWVSFPVWSDAKMTVGRFNRAFDNEYHFVTGGATDRGNYSWTERDVDGFAFDKSFGLGSFGMYVARSRSNTQLGIGQRNLAKTYDAWEATAAAKLQFTEQVGVDLGIQYFLGDSSSAAPTEAETHANWPKTSITRLKSMYTLFGGVRFDFNPNIGFKGIYYSQKFNADNNGKNRGIPVRDLSLSRTGAYRLAIDVKQDLLGFTSLWLGYDHLDKNFVFNSYNSGSLFLNGVTGFNGEGLVPLAGSGVASTFMTYGTSIYRLGATQQWNDKWRTWLYYSHYVFKKANALRDVAANQWALGLEYKYNPAITFVLNYYNTNFDTVWRGADDHMFRFRTMVTF